MLRPITLFLAVAGCVGLVAAGSMSLDILKGANAQTSNSVDVPTFLASGMSTAPVAHVEMPRCLLQAAAIWAALYLTSLILCRALIANGRGMVVLLVSTLLLVVAFLLSRAVDMFVVIAYLPALLVLLALWIRGAIDPMSYSG